MGAPLTFPEPSSDLPLTFHRLPSPSTRCTSRSPLTFLRPSPDLPPPSIASHQVHFPLSDLWKLQINSKGVFEWAEVATSGAAPFPRSRHALVAIPQRQIALLFGGRSVR